MPCAILVALFLNEIRKKAVKHVVQTVITFLHFISWVVMAGIITGLFGSSGAINGILTSIRLPSVSPISKASTFWEFIWASDWNRTSGLPLRRAPSPRGRPKVLAITRLLPPLRHIIKISLCNYFCRREFNLYITKRWEPVLQWGTTKNLKIFRNTSKKPDKTNTSTISKTRKYFWSCSVSVNVLPGS